MLLKVRTLTGKEIEIDVEPEYNKAVYNAKGDNGKPDDDVELGDEAERGDNVDPRDGEPGDKVYVIKERVEEKEGIPPAQQRLIFGGKQLADDKYIKDCPGLEGGATLHLVLALRGGA